MSSHPACVSAVCLLTRGMDRAARSATTLSISFDRDLRLCTSNLPVFGTRARVIRSASSVQVSGRNGRKPTTTPSQALHDYRRGTPIVAYLAVAERQDLWAPIAIAHGAKLEFKPPFCGLPRRETDSFLSRLVAVPWAFSWSHRSSVDRACRPWAASLAKICIAPVQL